jgi:hypothetical protein
MLVRVVVFATIVVSIASGTSQLKSFPQEKMDTINAIRDVGGIDVKDADDLVEVMFFYKQNKDLNKIVATRGDTLLVNELIGRKFPGLSLININDFYFHDTAAKIKNYLQETLDNFYGQLKAISDKAFIVKLSILPDLTFDLRYWSFILPILFAVTAIYSYILKFRIELLQLDAKKNNDETKKFTAGQFPYLYLRGLFELINLALILVFLNSIYDIVEHFPEPVSIYLIIFYVLTYYFFLVYIGTIHKKIFSDYLPKKSLLINRIWDWGIKKTKQFIRVIKYRNAFSIGVSFLLLTLFLSMSFQTCSHNTPGTIKGYQLIVDYKNKIWQYDDPPVLINRFYQINYISLFITTIFFAVLLFNKRKKIPLLYLKILLIYFSYMLIIFSMYFAFYAGIYPTLFICFQSALVLVLWIRSNYTSGFKKAAWNYAKLAETLAIYCLPLLFVSVYMLYKLIEFVAVWAFLYASILFLTFAYYAFFKDKS